MNYPEYSRVQNVEAIEDPYKIKVGKFQSRDPWITELRDQERQGDMSRMYVEEIWWKRTEVKNDSIQFQLLVPRCEKSY